MKILHCLYSNRLGGLEQAFINLNDMLFSLGHDVEILVPLDAPYLKKLETDFIINDFNNAGYYNLFSILKYRKLLKKINPDLIISHNSRATYVLDKSRLGLNIPLISFLHSNKIHRVRGADHIVVLTDDMKLNCIENGLDFYSISVLPNVIKDIPELRSYNPPNTVGTFKIGFIGRLSKEKGLQDLLEAISLIKDRFSIELHIAGSGADKVKIESLARKLEISERVFFSGWVDDVQDWINSIDLIVVPSRSETFGIVVLEAAAYGCPTIATNVPGPASQITNEVDGWLTEPCSPSSLADTIEKALLDVKSWPKIRRSAYARAHKYLFEYRLSDLSNILDRF